MYNYHILCPSQDMNECKISPCDTNAQCVNTPGSYDCTCNSGYEGDGHRCTGKERGMKEAKIFNKLMKIKTYTKFTHSHTHIHTRSHKHTNTHTQTQTLKNKQRSTHKHKYL